MLAAGAGAAGVAAVFSFHTIGIFSRHQPQVIEMQLRHLGEMYLSAGDADRALAAFHEGLARCPTPARRASTSWPRPTSRPGA